MLATFELVPRSQSFYHILSSFLTPYDTLSPRLQRNHFQLATLKLIPRPLISYHILSRLMTPYPLGWKQNHSMLATFKLVPRPQSFCHILSRFVTPYHNLSHLVPVAGEKTIFIWQS